MATLYDENGNPVSVTMKSPTSSGDTTAVVSLVLGILSIVFSFGYLIFPCAFGIPAILLGRDNVERSDDKRSIAKAGKICGIIGIVLGVVFMIVMIRLFVALYTLDLSGSAY